MSEDTPVDSSGTPAPVAPSPPPPPHHQQVPEKPWHSYISEDLPRTVQDSTDSAIRSARSFQNTSSTHLRNFRDLMPRLKSQYEFYEDAFFQKVKDELLGAKEHPVMAGGVAMTLALLLMPGPRRFLFRKTLGRFQSEEAKFVKAEKNVKELSISMEVMKNESRKLLERAALAEKDMKHGLAELRSAGFEIRHLGKSIYKAEAQATDLMNTLREIPGREALRLRADVASVAAYLQQQRSAVDKKIMKISELGISV